VFPLDDCLIASEPLMRLWTGLRPHLGRLPRHVTHLVLREDRDGGTHLVIRGGDPPWDAAPLAAGLGSRVGAIWWEPRDGAARVVAGAETGFPAIAFTQVQPALADRIRRDAVEALGDVAGRKVWDLYAGAGVGTRLLAGRGALVTSVEVEQSAVEWARRQPTPPGTPHGSPDYLAGRVEELLHRLPEPWAVLMNPPRTGAHARVLAALERGAASGTLRRLAYVSCDPATLSRDLTRLPSFRLSAVRAYDLFPQTSHVETVAVFEPR
jgi:23S rRNA (uracil1939-C5)-methyltransferase